MKLVWTDLWSIWCRISAVLFLWYTLYFGIKQCQARQGERLLRAESEARDARLSALR
jgi:hypothetical protein